MAAAGAAGLRLPPGLAKAGVGMLRPGYDFSLKTEPQAVLGLEKKSSEMDALRKTSASGSGDNTAASSDDAAAAGHCG